MAFKKTDLKYMHYKWEADTGDNPNYRGRLDRIKLDRHEGYEVVCFANAFAEEYLFLPDKDDLHKIEYMLINTVPSNIVMKDDIAAYINSKWQL